MDWKSYEELVKDIYQELGKKTGVEIKGFGKDCKVTGKSGVTHQIDVLTSFSNGLQEYLTAIECKYWKEKVNKDIVAKLQYIVSDCNFAMGIIVSKMGFTPDAIATAKSLGIGLVLLRNMEEKDWERRIKNIEITIVPVVPKLLDCALNLQAISPNDGPDGKHMQINAQRVLILYPDGDHELLSTLIENFFKEHVNEIKGKVFENLHSFPSGSRIKYLDSGRTLGLVSINLKGTYEEVQPQTSIIRGEEEILYYMKEIFQDKEFTISKDGKIFPRELQ